MKRVIIIGSGIAGLVAAINIKKSGCDVLVVTKEYPTQSQSSMAQGGINAALDGNIQAHIDDTIKSSQGLSDKKQVELMCHNAPKAIEFLDSIGVVFSRTQDAKIAQRRLGGTSSARACYARDYTGLSILQTLYDKALGDGIEFLNETFLVELHSKNNQIEGVSLLDKSSCEVRFYASSSVILATGGFAKIYAKHSTNSLLATGDGIAAALRCGAKLSNMEFIQFHPTALKNSSILISESARGMGAKLINSKNQRFVDELSSRDVVSKAIANELENNKEVFLDLRGIEGIENELPQELKLAKLYEGIDATISPIPIKPAAHYSMGGILVDANCQSSITGLFAVGECANHKVHGANRLGGNSLLELVVFATIAAQNAISCATKPQKVEQQNSYDLDKIFNYSNEINFYKIKDELSELFYNKVGITKDESSLKEALQQVQMYKQNISKMGLADKTKGYNTNLTHFLEFVNMLDLAEVVCLSSLARCETRGSHIRTDYPLTKNEFAKNSVIDKTLVVSYED